MSGLLFAIVDATGGATTTDGSKLDPQSLGAMAAILTVYANLHVASEYGGEHLVRAAGSPGDIRTGEIPFIIFPTLAEAPGAVAYHDRDAQGAPDCFDAITLSNSLMGAGNSLLVALSHEIAETVADPFANLLAIGDDGRGYAYEACDPVEVQTFPMVLDGYPTGYVSNFVLRRYFDPGAAGFYDFMSSRGIDGATAPPGPFQIAPGGGGNYQITYPRVGAPGQVTGSIVEHRRAKKEHPASRTARRLSLAA